MHNHDKNRPKSRDGIQEFQEDFSSGCIWSRTVLAVEIGEAMGQEGHFNYDNPLKRA